MNAPLQKAIELQKAGDLLGAVKVLRDAQHHGQRTAQQSYFLAVLEEAIGELNCARKSIEEAVTLAPTHVESWYAMGNIYSKLGENQLAIKAYEKTLSLKPDYLHAMVNLALELQRVEAFESSLLYGQRAVKLAPTELKAWLATIGTLGRSRQFAKGLQCCEEAVRAFGRTPELLRMNGDLFLASGNVENALECYEQALKLAPESVAILTAFGDCCAQHRNGREGIAYLQKALSLNPESLDTQHRLGTAYLTAGFPTDAVQMLLPVVQQCPTNADAFHSLILATLYLQDTDEREIYELHLKWNENNGASLKPKSFPQMQITGRNLRVGFVSPDFRNHSVARFMTPVLKAVEGNEVEVICYSDIKRKTDFTEKLQQIDVTWQYTYSLTDEQLSEKIRADGVDVLVDLAGHTGNNRLKVFARKPAPMQVSWLGYPHTTGLDTIDYRFSDAIADPPGPADEWSSETIVRLPDGFHCFEPPIELPEVADAPCVSNGFLTFGSFNNQSKINELTLERWNLLLKELPNARLLLKNHQLSIQQNRDHWRRVMEAVGIDLKRVEFHAYSETLEAHYSLYHRVDIGLDTFPYNGTTTTCEALWMGVPVLTLLGQTQRSRTAASLLTHSGLVDWVAKDETDFVTIAQKWNENPNELNRLRKGLRRQVEASPVGDGRAFAGKFFREIRRLASGMM